MRQWKREYKARNPGKNVASVIKRRAMKLAATPPWFGELDELVVNEAADLARLRRDATGFEWHVDHMIPLRARTACGLHCGSNLQVIPASLNTKKSNTMRLTIPCEWVAHV